MDWVRVLAETFHSACPRCGHLSVYTSDGRDRCFWPECSWPDAVQDRVARFTGNGAGAPSIPFFPR